MVGSKMCLSPSPKWCFQLWTVPFAFSESQIRRGGTVPRLPQLPQTANCCLRSWLAI
jgi:hypothetical protein